MSHGRYAPYPRRFGGGKYNGKPLLQVVHESLNAQRGLVFDSENSIAGAEHEAWARALVFDGWEVNARLGHQWDPKRTTDMLPRWEQIFKIRPVSGSSPRTRRREFEKRWQRFGELTNHARLETELRAALGDYFVAVEYISLENAVVHAPAESDGSYLYPWGTAAEGYPWYSTVAHILVRIQKPDGATEAQFYEAAGKVAQILDPILSAFDTFNWYRAPESTPIDVEGGPSAGGFYLDDPHNLDNNVFSE